jgi:hypothetical protein
MCFSLGVLLFIIGAWFLFFDPGTPVPASLGAPSPDLAGLRIPNFPNLFSGLGAFIGGATLLSGVAATIRV